MDNKVIIFQGYYLFAFEGIKNCDKEIEKDNDEKRSRLLIKKSTRKKDKFKLEIRIPITAFQLTEFKLSEVKFKKGVIEFAYKTRSEILNYEF